MENIIEVDGLSKVYDKKTVVNEVRFAVRRGEVFGLLGPNGAGKTTTIEMLEGLRKPDGGRATIAGFDTQKQMDRVKAVIGVQLQSTSMFDLLTVREMMELYASFYETSLPVEPLIDEMALREKMNARVKGLSGGQKQRLAIALALVNDPQVLFLDEPTTGLDPQARRVLWDIILKLKERGKTMILSTHYMDEAHVLCDRICLMDQGQIIALDTPQQLVKSLSSESAVEFALPLELATDSDVVTRFKDIWQTFAAVTRVEFRKQTAVLYSNDAQRTLVDLLAWCGESNVRLSDLSTRTATLEDVFIQMTGRSLRES
jgi:ABC-2 type transport system ATP-binding protein